VTDDVFESEWRMECRVRTGRNRMHTIKTLLVATLGD
jgi:ornithine carbamoyltransferase